jgi:hypothetical protein
MARLEVPLQGRTLRSTGDTVLRADLKLLLKDHGGLWKPVTFRVDTGTEMTTMPAVDARSLGLPIPRQPVLGLTLRGQEVRAGLLRARIVGMDPTEYLIPCYFLGDPVHPTPQPAWNLLGLTGVVDQFRLSFDGTPSVGSGYGRLVVEKL